MLSANFKMKITTTASRGFLATARISCLNLSIKIGMCDRPTALHKGVACDRGPLGAIGSGVRSTARRALARQQSRASAIVNKGKTTPSEASCRLVCDDRHK